MLFVKRLDVIHGSLERFIFRIGILFRQLGRSERIDDAVYVNGQRGLIVFLLLIREIIGTDCRNLQSLNRRIIQSY